MSKKNSKNITDFFRPFTIPKERIPRQDEEDEEIVVASSSQPTSTRSATATSRKHSLPPNKPYGELPIKRGRGRPRKSDPSSPSKLRLSTPKLEQSISIGSTPTRRSPRKNMTGLDGTMDAPPISSGLTTLPSSSQTSPTKMRVLEAVDIPSPVKEHDREPTPTQRSTQEPKATAANISFSSFSTLTSLSGVSSQSSSRRIVKKGVPAVTNSDSASMSSSSSEDELADFESFAPRKHRKLTPTGLEEAGSPATAASTKPVRISTRSNKQDSKLRTSNSWKPPSPPPTTSYKHSLLNIAKQCAQEAASEEKIAEAEAYVKESERLRTLQEEKGVEESESKHMAAALAEDSDDEERMLMAMDRTEALRETETFYFFRGQMGERMEVDFPVDELDSYGLTCLKESGSRERACTSGFVAVVASQRGLPDSLAIWLQSQILEGTSEELCESYTGILHALIANGHAIPDLPFSLSEIYIGQTFRDAEDSPKNQGNTPFPPNIKHTLKSMAALASQISPVHQASALAELILFNNDDNVRNDIDLQLHIEHAMHAILESNDDQTLHTVFQETTRQIMHASSISRHILSRAIAILPATTLPLHTLRRTLSLQILLAAPLDDPLDPSSPSTGVRLLLKLKKHPSFHISESSNYVALHSQIDLLDIAISAGFSDFTFLSHPQPPRTETEPNPQQKALFTTTQTPTSKAEAAYNEQIDAFTDHLKLMASKIRDAGTSHLKRTEAKSALERLVLRLECAVRTRPRPRKGVFDRGRGEVGAGMMRAFLKRDSPERKAGGGGKGVGEEEDSGSNGLDDSGFQRRPGKQHKVTWEDEIVGDDAEAGAGMG